MEINSGIKPKTSKTSLQTKVLNLIKTPTVLTLLDVSKGSSITTFVIPKSLYSSSFTLNKLDLTINSSSNTSTTVSACDSYTWSANSVTYTASGTYTVNTGCATEELVLTITPSTSNSTSASACCR